MESPNIEKEPEKTLIRYLCTIIPDIVATDFSNAEEGAAHFSLGQVIFSESFFVRGANTSSSTVPESFTLPLYDADLVSKYGSLFTNLETKSSFVVLRPVFLNGFCRKIPDMIRVFVRSYSIDSFFEKKGISSLEKHCSEEIFTNSMWYLDSVQKVVIETRDQLSRAKHTLFIGNTDNNIVQRSTVPQNRSEISLRNGKLAAEQRASAEAMLNTVLTAGHMDTPKSLAYVPWIEISPSAVLMTRSWTIQRNPLASVPMTKIQSVSRSEYTERFSENVGYLLCPRGSGRKRVICACLAMLNSSQDSETFVSNRKKSHTLLTHLSLSTCLVVCAKDSIKKWKNELEPIVNIIVIESEADFDTINKESIKGSTIILSSQVLSSIRDKKEDCLETVLQSSPSLQFQLKLSDTLAQRLYVNDIAERFAQSVLPLNWIHFRSIVIDDPVMQPSFWSHVRDLKADWIWIAHVSNDTVSMLPPSTVLQYRVLMNQKNSELNEIDFLHKWRLLHGEGAVISLQFPRSILHKISFKTIRVPVSRQENAFVTLVKNLVDLQTGNKTPLRGPIQNSEISSILLGAPALGVPGCSLDIAMSRKSTNATWNSLNIDKLEKNLQDHFFVSTISSASPASSGTTFAEKIMLSERASITIKNQAPTGSSSTFVLESFKKSVSKENVCGVCYCDPVDVFCLCGHGYCKPCTDVFSTSPNLVINCPTCRIPLCPFDWFYISNISNSNSAVGPTPTISFSAFGNGYPIAATGYKGLSKIHSIVSELGLMFKTRSRRKLQVCLLITPNECTSQVKSLLVKNTETQYDILDADCLRLKQGQQDLVYGSVEQENDHTVLNPEDEEDEDLVAKAEKDKKRTKPRIFVTSIAEFEGLNNDWPRLFELHEGLAEGLTGIILASPLPSNHSNMYLTVARIAALRANSVKDSKNLSLAVMYHHEYEEENMRISRTMLKREENEPKPRSHSSSIDLSPKR